MEIGASAGQMAAIVDELELARDRVRRLASTLPPERWARRSDPARWSPAECIAHLNLTSRAFLPLLRDAIAAGEKSPRHPRRYRRDVLGWMLWRAMRSRVKMRNPKKTQAFVPSGDLPAERIAAEFDALQTEQIELARLADGLPLNDIFVRSAFDQRARYNVYSAFSVLSAHQLRHIDQAERVWSVNRVPSEAARARGRAMRRGAVIIAACALVACGGVRPGPSVPADLEFVSRVEWGANPPVLPMRSHTITRLTVHHTGTNQNPQRSVAEKLRGLQLFSQRDDSLASGRRKPAWADVPYHFYVGVDGSVGEGRDWRYAGDTNTEYDPAGHLLVVVEGNFQRDTLTTAQRRALDLLIPAFAEHFAIPPERLASHRDFADTQCPGANLYAELPRFRQLIARAVR